MARTAWSVSGAFAKAFTIGGVVFNVIVSIPLDIIFMIKGVYDVDKYRRTGESNSNIAKEIGELVEMMETKIRECHGGRAGQLMITD